MQPVSSSGASATSLSASYGDQDLVQVVYNGELRIRIEQELRELELQFQQGNGCITVGSDRVFLLKGNSLLKKLLTPLVEDLYKKATNYNTNSNSKEFIEICVAVEGFDRHQVSCFKNEICKFIKKVFFMIGSDFIKNCLINDPSELKLRAFKWIIAHEIGHLCDPNFEAVIGKNTNQIFGFFYPKTFAWTEFLINNPMQISLITKLLSTSSFRAWCLKWVVKITPNFMANLFKCTPFYFIFQRSKKALIGILLINIAFRLFIASRIGYNLEYTADATSMRIADDYTPDDAMESLKIIENSLYQASKGPQDSRMIFRPLKNLWNKVKTYTMKRAFHPSIESRVARMKEIVASRK